MIKIKAILANSGISAKILTLVGSFLFFGLMGITLWKLFINGSPQDISAIKTLQIFTQIGAFILPAIFIGILCSYQPTRYLHIDKQPKALNILAIVLFMIIIIPFINLLGHINQQIVLPSFLKDIEIWLKSSEQQAAQTTEQLLNVQNISGLLLNIFVIALLPAIAEEFFFRGALQSILSENRNFKIAIWITAFIFSSIHFQFYGFIPRLLIGAFFGYLLFWSGNIWLTVTAHFTNNILSVLYFYLINIGYNLPSIDTVGTGNTLWIGCVSGAVAIYGIYRFKKYFLKIH